MSIRLIQGDCLEQMDNLIQEGITVDLILTDPPYGNVKGLTLRETANFRKEKMQWDNIIPIKPMFDRCYKLLKDNHNLLLFCDGKYGFDLYHNQYVSKLPYLYKYYWVKQNFANHFLCNSAPVNYIEEIFCFKKINSATENQELRDYAEKLWEHIGLPRAEIDRTMGDYSVNHFFRFNGVQFSIPSKEKYRKLTDIYNLTNYEGYKEYDELVDMKNKDTNCFRLNGKTVKSNMLYHDKTYHGSVHPTQKPVPLMEDLILTYTDEGDTVLDFTMGSGSTGVACKNTNRNFIGIELDEDYFRVATERINDTQTRLNIKKTINTKSG